VHDVRLEDYPWREFIEVRRRMAVWLYRWGNVGEPMNWDEVAEKLSMDRDQVCLIVESFDGRLK